MAGAVQKTHGMSLTPIYRIWSKMKSRCTYSYVDSYYLYGGRGIKVCEKWKTFAGFYEDMGKEYKEGLSLDRIDNYGNYELDNCRWVTLKEQANNTSRNHKITYDGMTLTLAQWSEITGIKSSTIRMRISKYGWNVKQSLGRV